MFIIISLFFNLVLYGIWCQDIERVVIPKGEPFAFDCQQDEAVYFGRRLNEWKEIEENNEIYSYLKLNFNYLTKENILRVTADSAELKHAGFYACRQTTLTDSLMHTIYQLILADVQSFYWNYICHGPVGSCQRTDDEFDENLSQLEVVDQTDIEIHCCASVTGYKKVNIHMNQLGDNRENIHVKTKQELDGSWIVCADQRVILKRTAYLKQQTLTCELITDDRHDRTLSSVIIMQDPMQINVYPQENINNRGSVTSRSRKRMTRGTKIAIIVGSIFGSLILLGLVIGFIIFFASSRKSTPSSSDTRTSNLPYGAVPLQEPQRDRNQRNT